MTDLYALPLAEQLRPKTLDDVIGQSHLLGPNGRLRLRYLSKIPQNMIFWGPPGVGKTTLAQLASKYFEAQFIALSAVLGGVKEVREAVELAKNNQALGKKTVLFIDEIHRFNKAQQDSLLPFTESGLITLIGATTENPSFELNRALLSRCEVYVLNPLNQLELEQLLRKSWDLCFKEIPLQPEVIQKLVHYADGDARRLLNNLQSLASLIPVKSEIILDGETVNALLGAKLRQFDKGGESFYDQISALHKSVRGSNPDAAMYWFCRMIDGGVDVAYLARRIVRMAWEDISLADPRAMQIANEAAMTYERLGSPEGELALASAVVYLSIAAKSNAVYKAYQSAMNFVKTNGTHSVPKALKNAPTPLMKNLNYGKNYRYPHDELHGYSAGVSYWPEALLTPPQFYRPTDRGLEIKISEKMEFLKQLDAGYFKKTEA